ncbi:glycosyl hydrolase family 38 domain-containing protein [Colletotrichum incanum]|uniref:Glycosyl hydrolase family 38 domain-containing protein n=1 Tax=Colletotrichum incanum TaxID=1573173 RepID=A0A161YGL9_COLIC|nr:glycosyl hydrolase family 38 domain-containing protein [Colletotrichum incanum]OHW96610.1 alpha-mannosidase [Colletotrichum incanum]
MCCDDSNMVYTNVYRIGNKLLQNIYKVLKIRWARKEVVTTEDGKDVIAHDNGNLLPIREAPTTSNNAVSVNEVFEGVFRLQNSRFTVTVEKGCITALFDRRAKRQVLSGRANKFVIFDDKPIYWQAWDVEVFHLETREELQSSITFISEKTPLRVSVVTETKISDVSSIKTTISLPAAFDDGDDDGDDDDGSHSYVECTAEVDWHETMRFLKVEFPVDVRHHEASYDTQFGVIRRPTHYNTSWDMAKFEVCCHKYADLSEYGYGVSILNDSKYGFATVGNTMRLSLLPSSEALDDKADMGKHTIRWAILPLQGSLGPETVRAAFNFNNPLKLVSISSDSPLNTCPITLTGDQNLVLDTLKRGEDDEDVSLGELSTRPSKSIIARVYESLGGRVRGKLETRWRLRSVHKTNILEDDEEDVLLDNKQL